MRKFVCSICGYIYEEEKGIPEAGIVAGTWWEALPDDWVCPLCGADKSMFKELVAEPEVKAPVAGAVVSETEALQAMEKSIICSNLALSCEKQRMLSQAEAFQKLAQVFRQQAGSLPQADWQELAKLAKQATGELYPQAESLAKELGRRGSWRALSWTGRAALKLDILVQQQAAGKLSLAPEEDVFVCSICGYIHIGTEPPERCPVCNVPALKFVKVEGRNA